MAGSNEEGQKYKRVCQIHQIKQPELTQIDNGIMEVWNSNSCGVSNRPFIFSWCLPDSTSGSVKPFNMF